MRLDRIVLENLRQYEGRQSLEFAPPGAHNVTLIRGLNGAGKTHLLEALRWCLYGLDSGESAKDLVSKGRLSAAHAQEEFQTAVELFFDHEGRSYSARRALRVKVGADLPDGTRSYAPIDDGFTLFELQTSGNAREIAAPIEEMKGILGRDAAAYFFFDGEKIDSFARAENVRGISEAVRSVLRLVDLDRAIAHLDDVRGEYERTLRTLAAGTPIEKLLEERLAIEGQLIEHRNRLTELDGEFGDVQRIKASIDAALLDMRAATDLITQRQALEGRLDTLDQRKEALLLALAQTLAHAPSVLAHGALRGTAALAESKRTRGEIPSKVRDVVAKDLLEAGRCICGRLLAEGTEEHKAIAAIQRKAVPTALEEKVILSAAALPAIAVRSTEVGESLKGSLKQLHATAVEATDSQAKITEIKNQLADVRQEDIRELVERGRKADRQFQDLIAEQMRRKTAVNGLEARDEDLEAQIKNEEHISSKAERVRRRAGIAREAEAALRETRDRFVAEVRAAIESGTSDMFRKLIWKPAHFEKVEVSDSFGLSLVDKWGAPALADLSAGETEVLSLAFIVTMGRVAAEAVDSRAPVVIDSPFGRLSAEPRENIAKTLPSMVDQLVLLVTDTELVATEAALLPRVGKRFELEFDSETSATAIIEVGVHG